MQQFKVIGLVALVLLFYSGQTFANSFWLGVGPGGRFQEKTEGDSLKSVYPWALSGGHRFRSWGLAAELSRFEDVSGSPSVEIKSVHHELLLGARFWPWSKLVQSFSPYFSAGLGFYQVQVHSRIVNMSSDNYSEIGSFPYVGAGTWGSLASQFFGGAEVRVRYSTDFDPSLAPELFLRLGIQI